MNTSQSSPNSEHANASDDPHWPAPVSVTSFLIPAFAFSYAWGTDRRQVVGAGGLLRARVERRQRAAGQIGQQVDPVGWDVALLQEELRRLVGHDRAS
jgi:hypothetical protein